MNGFYEWKMEGRRKEKGNKSLILILFEENLKKNSEVQHY